MTFMRHPGARVLACAIVAAVLPLSPATADAGASDWTESELGRIIERELDRAFDQLEPAQREIILLRYQRGLSSARIGPCPEAPARQAPSA